MNKTGEYVKKSSPLDASTNATAEFVKSVPPSQDESTLSYSISTLVITFAHLTLDRLQKMIAWLRIF